MINTPKNILFKIILLLFLLFGSFEISRASIFDTSTPWVKYCQDTDECWLGAWIKQIKGINDIETTRSASEYIQDIVRYLLTFITIVAVIYIIYAWFNIVTWAWDEEKNKKSKNIIIYVIIWIVIIYLAAPIIGFVLEMFNNA